MKFYKSAYDKQGNVMFKQDLEIYENKFPKSVRYGKWCAMAGKIDLVKFDGRIYYFNNETKEYIGDDYDLKKYKGWR